MSCPGGIGITVTLTWYEHELACFVGTKRTIESSRRGTANHIHYAGHSLEGIREQTDINAAGAELAVAKVVNRNWLAGINTPNLPDVGKNIEVRWSENHHNLLIRERDHNDRVFVLVRGSIPTFQVVGWIRGEHAKRECWKKNPNGDGECYLVPDTELKTFNIGEPTNGEI